MKRIRFLTSLPPPGLASLDELCRARNVSRAVILEEALRQYLGMAGLDLTSGQARELAEAIGART